MSLTTSSVTWPLIKICLHWKLHYWPHYCCQWWGNLCGHLYALTHIPWGHYSLTENLGEKGRHKSLCTCGSHITVMVLYFVSCIFMYVRPPSTLTIDNSLNVFYTIITPMLNPFIYTLINGEMKNAMKKLWTRKRKLNCMGIFHLFSMRNCNFQEGYVS